MPEETFSMEAVIKYVHDVLDLTDRVPVLNFDELLDEAMALPIDGLSESYTKITKRTMLAALMQSKAQTRESVDSMIVIIGREHGLREKAKAEARA